MVDDGPLAPLLAWLRENSHCRLPVEELTARVAISPRNFARVFLRETCIHRQNTSDSFASNGQAPIGGTSHAVKTTARQSGFVGVELMR